MKLAKLILMLSIIVSICSSYSMGQSSSGSGKNAANEISHPGILGLINDGAGVYPVGDVNNAKVYPDEIRINVNISRLEFICNTISSCGIYGLGKNDNSDGAIVNLGQVTSGATIPGIDSSVVRITETTIKR